MVLDGLHWRFLQVCGPDSIEEFAPTPAHLIHLVTNARMRRFPDRISLACQRFQRIEDAG